MTHQEHIEGEWMMERDPNFMDDGDPAKGPQPMEWKWYVGEGLRKWMEISMRKTIMMRTVVESMATVTMRKCYQNTMSQLI